MQVIFPQRADRPLASSVASEVICNTMQAQLQAAPLDLGLQSPESTGTPRSHLLGRGRDVGLANGEHTECGIWFLPVGTPCRHDGIGISYPEWAERNARRLAATNHDNYPRSPRLGLTEKTLS